MAVTLKVDGTTGTVAIYTGTDDLPFTTPLSYVSRIRFHSELDYPRIISTHSGSFSLDATSSGATTEASYELFAHGLGGIPFVEGYITLSGVRVPLLGSICVSKCPNTALAVYADGFARWLHLGADGTNVIIREFSQTAGDSSHPAQTINWVVYLTDTVI